MAVNISKRKAKKMILIGVFLILFLRFIPFVSAQTGAPTIGEFQAPSTVYANKYFYLNATINDVSGTADFLNATIEISFNIVLKWNNATNVFSKYQDTNNYCTLDATNSIKTGVNSTAFKLSWKIKLAWSCSDESVDVVSTNTKIFDSTGKSGTNSQKSLFTFENDLVIYSASIADDRVNPNQLITFNGTLYYRGTTTPPGTNNSALSFDGIDDYIDCGNNVSLFPSSAITVAAWVKPNNIVLAQQIISSRGNKDLNSGIEFQVSSSGVQFYTYIDGVGWKSSGSTSINIGVWSYVVGTLDGSTIAIYVNGAMRSSNPQTGSIKQTQEKLAVGKDGARNASYFNGVIDDVRIYNRSLSTTEISEHYQGIYSNERGLVLYLDFDDDTKDKSGQNNHGANYGASWTNGCIAGITTKIELSSTLKKSKPYFYSATGAFSMSLVAESKVSSYSYIVYAKTDQNTVQNQTVKVIVDRIKIVSKGATHARTNIGENADIYFVIQYDYDGVNIDSEKGTVYINGTVANWDAVNNRWKITVSQSSVGSWVYAVSSVSDKYYGLTVVYDIAGDQQEIWDRIEIFYFSVDRSRVNVNDIEVRVKAHLGYDHHALGSNDSILVNGTALTWDPENGWFKGTFKAMAGQWSFEVSSGKEVDYGITAIYYATPKPIVLVWEDVTSKELIQIIFILLIIVFILLAVILRRYWLPRIRFIIFHYKTKKYFKENLGAPFIVGFQALLLTCAGLLILRNLELADEVAVYAYFLLVIGVVLQLISFERHRKDQLHKMKDETKVD